MTGFKDLGKDLGKKFNFKAKRDERPDCSSVAEKPDEEKSTGNIRQPGYGIDPFKDKDIKVARELGKGGFATVWEVNRKGLMNGDRVAMRVVPLKFILTGPLVYTTEDLRKRMVWALEMMSKCDCPYIVRFLDCRITKTHMVGFMTLASGGDLFDRVINSGPDGHFEEEDAKIATRNLCEAVNWVHLTAGIIHRDIKPEKRVFLLILDDLE